MLNLILASVNVIFAVALILATVCNFISPSEFTLIAELGLGFPLILVINIACCIFWIVRFKFYFTISLFAIILNIGNIKKTFAFNNNNTETKADIKILTYNVHLFNFYKPKDNRTILDYLCDSGADIICLQEFGYKNEKSKEESIKNFKKTYPYNHIDISNAKKNGSYGVATFSKYPIVNTGKVNYNSLYNSTIYSDININGKIIRQFNCHLESNKLTENDKALVKNLESHLSKEKLNLMVTHLSRKLSDAYKEREEQAKTVSNHIINSPHPVIVCGDFNDVPVSYTYSTIKGDNLTDAFVKSGNGYCHTFNEKFFWFRIDHILYDKNFCSINYKVDNINTSDHYPVIGELKWNEDKQ